MRSLNRNVRPPFQETPDQPLLSPEDIMIYDVIRAPKQYFAPGPTKPLGGQEAGVQSRYKCCIYCYFLKKTVLKTYKTLRLTAHCCLTASGPLKKWRDVCNDALGFTIYGMVTSSSRRTTCWRVLQKNHLGVFF